MELHVLDIRSCPIGLSIFCKGATASPYFPINCRKKRKKKTNFREVQLLVLTAFTVFLLYYFKGHVSDACI